MVRISERADERFRKAMEAVDARDPRPYYRERLKELKKKDPDAYRRAVEYYEQRLLPAVADEGSDPLEEWIEYGRVLATLTTKGKTVQVDPTGRATPYRRPVGLDRLVLHLPASSREPAVPIGIPRHLSPAQRATYDLLLASEP